MTGVVNIPELPHEKDFHIFVSSSSDDHDVAITIINHLERLGVKCCYHERDFMPGVEIIHNTNKSINDSMYVLILLSEKYAERPFCTHEASVALYANIVQKTEIIPVKIEPCEIPQALSHVTYIDSADGNYENLHTKIIDKMMKRVISGYAIDVFLTRTRSKPEIVFDDLKRFTIKAQHTHVSDEDLDSVAEFMNKSLAIRHYDSMKDYNSTCLCILGFLVCVVIELVCGAMLFLSQGPDKKPSPGFQVCLVSAALLLLLSIVVWVVLRYCMRRLVFTFYTQTVHNVNSSLWTTFNQTILWKRHFLYIYDNGSLKVMQYNAEPCVRYFSRRIKDDDSLVEMMMENEQDKDLTRRIFNQYLQFNSTVLTKPEKHEPRHPTHNGAPCLCLLVQKWRLNL